MIDIGGNDRTPPRNLISHEFRRDHLRDRGAPRLARMLGDATPGTTPAAQPDPARFARPVSKKSAARKKSATSKRASS